MRSLAELFKKLAEIWPGLAKIHFEFGGISPKFGGIPQNLGKINIRITANSSIFTSSTANPIKGKFYIFERWFSHDSKLIEWSQTSTFRGSYD